MNNEPVAWMLNGIIHECDPSDWAKEQYPDQDVIPLYTHQEPQPMQILEDGRIVPVFRELTDEEILDFINAFCLDMGDYWELTERNAIPMIRAILRKASEK